MAILYKINGQQVGIDPANGKHFTLAELKQCIGGGYIQIVPLHKDRKLLVCDEDGRFKRLPPNETATRLFGSQVIGGDFVGDILVCPSGQIE